MQSVRRAQSRAGWAARAEGKGLRGRALCRSAAERAPGRSVTGRAPGPQRHLLGTVALTAAARPSFLWRRQGCGELRSFWHPVEGEFLDQSRNS